MYCTTIQRPFQFRRKQEVTASLAAAKDISVAFSHKNRRAENGTEDLFSVGKMFSLLLPTGFSKNLVVIAASHKVVTPV